MEKDNACDRVDVCEEQCKAAKVKDKDKDKAQSFLKMSLEYFNISNNPRIFAAEGVQGRGRGGRADDEGEAAGDRVGPHH